MVKLKIFLCVFLLCMGPLSAFGVSLKDRVEVLEQRVVDFERLQQEQSKAVDRRLKKAEKKAEQLLKGYRGFFDELESFRDDLRQIGGTSEEVEHGKRQLSLQFAELERKLEAQGVEIFELKELIKAQEKAPSLSSAEADKQFAVGMKHFKKKRWTKAQVALLKLAGQTDNPKVASEALYYGSFAAVIQKKWAVSNPGFSDLISLYPKSRRVLDARWQLASGLIAQGKTSAGKTQLKLLSKQKTNKKLARKAKAKLKQLK